jgi:hypothetical protein
MAEEAKHYGQSLGLIASNGDCRVQCSAFPEIFAGKCRRQRSVSSTYIWLKVLEGETRPSASAIGKKRGKIPICVHL